MPALAIERSVTAIRAALNTPQETTQFDAEMRQVEADAASQGVLAVDAVLIRWHALATMAANPLTPDEQAQLARARAGDFSGFGTRDEHGGWGDVVEKQALG